MFGTELLVGVMRSSDVLVMVAGFRAGFPGIWGRDGGVRPVQVGGGRCNLKLGLDPRAVPASGTATARTIDLTREWGVSRQAVSKRKQKILQELRRQVGMP